MPLANLTFFSLIFSPQTQRRRLPPRVGLPRGLHGERALGARHPRQLPQQQEDQDADGHHGAHRARRRLRGRRRELEHTQQHTQVEPGGGKLLNSQARG